MIDMSKPLGERLDYGSSVQTQQSLGLLLSQIKDEDAYDISDDEKEALAAAIKLCADVQLALRDATRDHRDFSSFEKGALVIEATKDGHLLLGSMSGRGNDKLDGDWEVVVDWHEGKVRTRVRRKQPI